MTDQVTVFGFGSFFDGSSGHRDVDFLVLHGNTTFASSSLAIACKKYIVERIDLAHVTMLSKLEERQLGFIQSARAVELGSVSASSIEEDVKCIVETLLRTP